jgi:hypothetical protein
MNSRDAEVTSQQLRAAPPSPNYQATTAKGIVAIVGIHLFVLLLTCLISLSNNKSLLLLGYDGTYYRTLIKLQHEWMSLTPWFGHNPFQALGNTFFHVNTRFAPASAIPASLGHGTASPILVYTLFAFEMFLSSLFMFLCLRIRLGLALLSSWSLALLATPFTFPPMIYPISTIAPHFLEFVAAECVLLGLFCRIGQHRWFVSAGLTFAMIGVGCLCFICSAVTIILIAPAVALFMAVSLGSAATRGERWSKALSLAAMFAALAPGGIPYFVGNVLYTVPGFFSKELMNDRMSLAFVSVLFHRKLDGWFGPILIIGALSGAALACYSGSGLFRKLAWGTLGASFTLIGVGLYLTYRAPHYSGPSPLYFEWSLWPFQFLMLAFLIATVAGVLHKWLRLPRFVALSFPVIAVPRFHWLVLLLPAALVPMSYVDRGKSCYYPYAFPPDETPVIQTLRDKIGLCDGADFHGTVATFTGYSEMDGVHWHQIQKMDYLCNRLDHNDYRTMGLWYFGIPTLFEYNQLMSPTYYLMMSRMLSRTRDRQIRNVIVLTKPHIQYLQSLGVRFVLADFQIAESNVVLRQKQQVGHGEGPCLNLYELALPNLATYSPTRITVARSAKEILDRLQEPGFDFRTQAIADGDLPVTLVKAESSHMQIYKDKIVFKGRSAGTSVVLLPLQYSHCLDMKVHNCLGGVPKPKLVRLNLLQTGIIFTGPVEVELQFCNGPFRNPFGRLADYFDLMAAIP